MLEGMAWCLRFSSRFVGRAVHVDEAVFLAGFGLLNRIVGRFFEIHQHMSVASIFWELCIKDAGCVVGDISQAFLLPVQSGVPRQKGLSVLPGAFKNAPIERA